MKQEKLNNRMLKYAKEFKLRALEGFGDEKRHDLVKGDEQKWMWIAYKQLGWSFAKIGSVFNRDRRTTKKAVEGYKVIEKTTQQKPYEENPHKQKMRELAKVLAGRISLPSLFDEDLWRDLPTEFLTGKYSLPIGVVEIGEDKQIKVNYSDIGAGNALPHLVEGLYSHLGTSGLSRFVELVGDKGRFNDWVSGVGQYSEALLGFLKLIVDEVKSYKDGVSFRDEAKAGLTKWFLLIVWNDVIQKASGYSWIDDSWYKPHESIPGTNLWKLNCGAYAIGFAKSKRTLKTYENWHKKLRGKYIEYPLVKGIGAKYQELSNTAEQIRQRLQEFSDIEHLPGHCKLCCLMR